MKKIVFATDFSKNSKFAFSYAVKFARAYNAEISLVHIYQMPTVYDYPYTEYTQAQEKIDMTEARNELEQMYNKSMAEHEDISNIKYRLIKDPSVVHGLSEMIKKVKPDLLMLSTIGDMVAKEFVFGKVIKRLVRECLIPVSTIPPEAKFRDISNVLFTTNYNIGDLLAMKELIHLLDPIQPAIKMAHVRTYSETESNPSGEAFGEMIKNEIDYQHIQFEVMNGTNVYKRLNEYIVAEQPNLLVMTDKNNGFWYDLFHIDLIERLEMYSSTPVLTYNAIGLSHINDNDLSMNAEERL